MNLPSNKQTDLNRNALDAQGITKLIKLDQTFFSKQKQKQVVQLNYFINTCTYTKMIVFLLSSKMTLSLQMQLLYQQMYLLMSQIQLFLHHQMKLLLSLQIQLLLSWQMYSLLHRSSSCCITRFSCCCLCRFSCCCLGRCTCYCHRSSCCCIT